MGGGTSHIDEHIPDATDEEKAQWELVNKYDTSTANQGTALTEKGYDALTNVQSADFNALGAENQSRLDDIYSKWSDLYEGKLDSNYQTNMENALKSGYENTMGSALNTLGNRGVLNSKVTTSAVNSQQKNLNTAMANAYNTNIGTAANLLTGRQSAANQKLTDAGLNLTNSLILPTSYYTVGSTLANNARSDWKTMYNDRYSIATPAQTITESDPFTSVLGGLLTAGASAYGASACFIADTLVRVVDGVKHICDVVVGDVVLSFDNDKNVVERKVVGISSPRFSPDDYFYLECNGRNFITTAAQPFVCVDKICTADSLVVGDVIVCLNGDFPVDFISTVDDKELVYDICVEGNNTYFANNCLTVGGEY